MVTAKLHDNKSDSTVELKVEEQASYEALLCYRIGCPALAVNCQEHNDG